MIKIATKYGPYGQMTKLEWKKEEEMKEEEKIDHPKHYTSHPSGIEAITICEHMTFNVGNAIKYLWRAGIKSPNAIEDLKKAAWYIAREIERLSKEK